MTATAQRAASSSAGSRASLLIGAALVSATVGCNDRSNAATPASAADANAQAGVEPPHPSAEIYGAPPAMDDERSDAGGPVIIERPPASIYGGPPPSEPMPPKPKPKP